MLRTANIALTEQEQQTLQMIAEQTGTTQAELLRQAVQRFIAEFQSPNLLLIKSKRRQRSPIAQSTRIPPTLLKGTVTTFSTLLEPVVSDKDWEASLDRTALQIAGDSQAFK